LRRGIYGDALSPSWNEVVFFLQKFITCEGRINVAYRYHIKLLMHLTGGKPLNMPSYLHKSLTKMAESMRKKRSLETALYHKGFIMMIINAELERLGVPWSTFAGQIATKPRARVLPPKKELSQRRESMTPRCRRSTRMSKKVMGSNPIIHSATESEGEE
jgi:hypothetical protein